MKYCLVVFFTFSLWLPSMAQDTVMVLPESTVHPEQNDPRSEQQWVHKISLRSSNLNDLLFSEIGINVRSNSGQGLSTMNFRGFGPDQTRISWNGIPINNPMNGQADLALFPVFLMDQASISADADIYSYNNPVGGELSLQSGIPSSKDSSAWVFKPYYGAGSFGRHMAGLDYVTHSEKWSSRSRAIYSIAENNYPYYPFGDKSNDIKTMAHASVEGIGLMQDVWFGKNKLSVWLQSVERDIPSAELESKSKKHQSDRHIRMSYNRQQKNRFGMCYINGGLSIEELVFTDKVSSTNSENNSFSGFYSLRQEIFLNNNLKWTSSLDGQLATARTSTYGQVEPRLIFNFSQYLNWIIDRWSFTPGMKLSALSLAKIYLLPSARLKYQHSTSLLSVFSYRRGLRFPTMNHLYWEPGGNENTEAEKSDNLSFKLTNINKYFNSSIELFGTWIYDRIQWLPDETGLFVVSQETGKITTNYGASVQTRGYVNLYRQKNLKMVWSLNYNLVRSNRNDRPDTIQSIFIPIHQFGGRVGVQYKGYYLGWTQSYVSKRFTTTTNDDWMQSYQLSDLIFSSSRDYLTISLRVSNLFNSYYEMLPLRPMPSRSLQINLQYNIQSKVIKK